MKQTNILYAIAVCTALFTTSACNNAGTKTSGTADTITTRTDSAVQEVKQAAATVASDARTATENNPDSSFVVKAAAANMEELALLQAGIENGTSSELKAHAKMMMGDHKKLGTGVKAYAAKTNYTLPADDGGKSAEDMNSLSSHSKGADWDKAWVDMLVDKHSDAISMFEKGQMDVKDATLKSMIGDALPTFHKHLDMLKMLQDKMKK